jgi:hypothetical protein
MTDLPRPALPTGSIELGGARVEYRSLSRAQALELNSYKGREDEAEDFMLACGLDCSMDDAHAWRAAVSFEVGGQLLDAIIELSGLTDQVKVIEDDDPKD